MKRLKYVIGDTLRDGGEFQDTQVFHNWLQQMVELHPDYNYFFTTDSTDIEEDGINYKELLHKYIDHVGVSEGITYLSKHSRENWSDSPKFTDAEWDELVRLDHTPRQVTRQDSDAALEALRQKLTTPNPVQTLYKKMTRGDVE